MAKAVFDPNEDYDDEVDPFADLDDSVEDLSDIGDPFTSGPTREPTRSLEDFEDEVDQNIKRLMAAKKVDAKDRRDIAYWLGESGSPKAITALALVYKKDSKNKQVQQAAAYALGQFKALDEAIERDPGEPVAEALARPENAWIVELLTNIALHDERGKRLRRKTGTLVKIMIGLTVLLVALVGAYIVIPGKNVGQTVADRLDLPPAQIYAQVQQRIPQARSDVTTLQGQFDTAATGGTLNCSITLQNPAGITIPAAMQTGNPALNGLVGQYKTAIDNLTLAKEFFREACNAQPPALNADIRERGVTALTAAGTALTQAEAAYPGVQAEIDTSATATAATAQAAGTAQAEASNAAAITPSPSVEPETPTPTSGITRQQLNAIISDLYRLIDGATGIRGHTSLLNQNWITIRDQRRADMCQLAQPDIPADYALPPDTEAFVPQAVKDAILQVNAGQQLSRDGWNFFKTVCSNGTVFDQVEIGLATTSTAQTAYDFANTLLQSVGQ